jgi:predicted  nucleic acid-binding Zn-ribbon protein
MSSSKSSLKSTPTFQVNDRVKALFHEDGKWYPAEVLEVKSNNTFRIRFDGYVEEYDFEKKNMRALGRAGGGAAAPPAASENEEGSKCKVDSALKSTSTFHVNDRVEALWLMDGKWYPATVSKVLRNNRFRIRFDDVEIVAKQDYGQGDLRVLVQGSARAGGGAAVPPAASAKETAPAPGNSKRVVFVLPRTVVTDPARDDRAQMQQEQSQAAATIDELKAQVERLANELSSSQAEAASSRRDAESARHDLRAAEQQASDDSAQMQQEQSQAAATIDELKAQVERLANELSSSQAEAASSRRDAESARHDLRAAEQQASDDSAQMQQEQSQAAATIDELKAQVERLANELSSSQAEAASSRRDAESARHDLRAAEQQASDDSAQMQQEQSQAAATIDELKAQVERLANELSINSVSAVQAFQDEFNAYAESFKQRHRTAAPADHLCHRAPSTVARAAHAAAAGDGSASSAALTPEAIKAMSSNSMAILATQRAGITEQKCIPALKKVLKGISFEEWSPDRLRPVLEGHLFFQLHPAHVESIVSALVGMRAEAESAATAAPTVQAEAAAQLESQSVDERAQAPVSAKLQDSSTSEEQVRQTLAVQHCGS